MDTDLAHVLAAAGTAGLQVPGETPPAVVVLISGGRDSVCLLDVARTLCGPARVHALHVNYGLRATADDDELHVVALCERMGVALTVERTHRPADAPGNLQAWARDVRYAVATRLALAHGALVATGHTATDQVETVLYRLAASPGRRALLGMAPLEGRLLRPLLTVTREDTAAYCRARGLDWRDDATNDTATYARGRLRHGLVAALRDVHPAAEANVLRTAALLRDEAAVLDEVVSGALDGRRSIAVERLAALAPALARLIVVRLAEDAGSGLLPAAGRRLDELLALGAQGGSAALDLGGGVRAIVEYGVLRFSAQPEEPVPAAVELAVPGRVRFGTWEVICELASDHGDLLDADPLGASVRVRSWRIGDRMAPIGLGGTRTLADLFTDRRIPRSQRRTIPLLEVDGAIAWVPGVATDERFRVSGATRRTARLSATRLSPPALAPA